MVVVRFLGERGHLGLSWTERAGVSIIILRDKRALEKNKVSKSMQ